MKAIYAWTTMIALFAVASLGATHEARSQRPGEPRVAKIQHIMAGIQQPGMQRLQRGIRGSGPADDEGWGLIGLHSALMNEVSFMLMQNDRSKDAVWAKAAADLRAASAAVNAAAGKKDLATVREGVQAMGGACKSCHDVHRK